MTLLDRLKENSDEKLKIFNARLTPSVASERILGVRSPVAVSYTHLTLPTT